MARRPCCKRVEELPGVTYFKPRAVPLSVLEEVVLSVEELEALRLAHKEGLYQQAAAERMAVSRATFGRVLDAAHRKVTRALVDGCALRIEGGSFSMGDRCERCPAKATAAEGESPCEACPVRRKEPPSMRRAQPSTSALVTFRWAASSTRPNVARDTPMHWAAPSW